MSNPLANPRPWDGVADGYVSDLLPFFTRYAQDALRLAALPANAEVLDVAAGPGTLALLAAQAGAKVTAVDFSLPMVEHLRELAKARKLSGIEAQVGDGQRLLLANDHFHAAFCLFGLIFFPDRGQGFRELLRVLKPGGCAVISTWVPVERVPTMHQLWTIVGELLPNLPFGGGKAPLGEPDEIRLEMAAAGFVETSVHSIGHTLSFPSVAAFWQSMLRSSPPLALLREKLGEKEWTVFNQSALARLSEKLGEGVIRAEWPALIGLGRKP